MDSSAASYIKTSRDGAITTVTLNRPDKRNALCVELLEQLCAAVAAAENDPSQRVLVVRGEGPAFCAGLDLAEAAQPERAHQSAEWIARSLAALSGSRLVTVALVHGAAIAGGAGLMSACDFAVAVAETKIGYPEPRRGLVAGLVMTFLRRQLRERDAREALLGGEIFTAEHARTIGLLNRVAPDLASAEGEVMKFATTAMQGGPQAIAHTKQLLAELWPRTVKEDLDHALAFHLKARNSPEAQEGIAAFREKRAPRWAQK